MEQAIFDDDAVFKIKEKVIKVVPKKSKGINDISVDELKVLCFHNHKGVCFYLGSDIESCGGVCYMWTCLKESIIKESKKKGNKFYVDLLDLVNKVECLKGYRASKERRDGRNIMQTRVDV